MVLAVNFRQWSVTDTKKQNQIFQAVFFQNINETNREEHVVFAVRKKAVNTIYRQNNAKKKIQQ